MEIPKIIHYCWFGNNEKPEIILKCMETWKKFLPGWEIIEWNEQNYDVNKIRFTKEAYQEKKWAFVSDYCRFDVLYEHGGVYFDTDVELLKEIPLECFDFSIFTGVESSKYVSPGLIMGATKEHPFIKEIMDEYQSMSLFQDGKIKLKTVNEITTELLVNKGYVMNGIYQEIEGIAIYPAEVFCGYDLDIREPMITENTVALHHYTGSWKKKTLNDKLLVHLKRMIGVNNYRKLLEFKRKMVAKK